MPSSKFNDFSSLKSLQKELENNNVTSTPPKIQEAGRKQAVKHKSTGCSKGGEKVSAPGLRPGMKVTLMDSNDRGVIKHVRKECVEIELDSGFVIPVGLNDFVVNDAEEESRLLKSVGALKSEPSAVVKPVYSNKAVEIDLHIEAIPGGHSVAKGQELPFQLEYFRTKLRAQLKHRGSRIIFVHGVGDGILKAAVRQELDTAFAISCSWNPYGEGATAVTVK